jgi:probable HAF family extracellular repeat protein
MKRWVTGLVCGLVVAGLAVPGTAQAQAHGQAWRVVDLGTGDESTAYAVNDSGHVVGRWGDGKTFLWRHGRVTDLGVLGGALGVNDHDEVVGYRFTAAGMRAFLWRRGTVVDLGTLPGGDVSYAQAVNDRGEVVGFSMIDGQPHAFSWRNGVMTDLGPGLAEDINDAGQIVGEQGGHAVRWWHGRITVLSDASTEAIAVSRSGAVAGNLFDDLLDGFVWTHGKFTVLRAPAGDEPFMQPYGINDRLQVVGASHIGAFLWEHGRTTILPDLNRVSYAEDINDAGVIVGASATTMDGLVPHAVLWTR